MSVTQTDVTDDEGGPVHQWRCDECRAVLYYSSRKGLRMTPDGLEPPKGSHRGFLATGGAPVVIEYAEIRRVMCCSKACLLRLLLRVPEHDLRSGYPLCW